MVTRLFEAYRLCRYTASREGVAAFVERFAAAWHAAGESARTRVRSCVSLSPEIACSKTPGRNSCPANIPLW
jgi:hypothetical protein